MSVYCSVIKVRCSVVDRILRADLLCVRRTGGDV